MKVLSALVVLAVIALGCSKSNDQHHVHSEMMNADSANTILYSEVMAIHDEVMPKMEKLYNIEKSLRAALENAPEAERPAIQARLHRVDSVSKLMMDWMHDFNPPSDTTGAEQVREYLEDQMEKIRQVKDAMLSTIEAEKAN